MNWNTGTREKITTPFHFPQVLDMAPFVSAATKPGDAAAEHKYELYSILMHAGGTHGGHYYAFIKVTQ